MSHNLNTRILVVDDDPRLADSTRAVLALEGYNVETLYPPSAAVARINTGVYDLVLLDVNMPDMTGFQLMDALDREELDTLFIVITGDTAIDTAIAALRRGASDYIRKPCDPDELLIRVSRALEQRRLAREHGAIEAEKQNLETQLRQSQKMEAIGTLTGGIAHDFNNILGIILGNTELAKRAGLPDQTRQHMDNILIASMRAKELINQLLSFSRKAEAEWKQLELGSILQESLGLVRASIPRNITVELDVPEHACFIQGDATQLHQVILNLCTNAAHAMEPAGGTLTVALDSVEVAADVSQHHLIPGTHARLRIRDTGHGIPADIVDRVFDPYFTTKDPGQGTGMGLAVVHGIVKHHNGSIKVDSTSHGTQFEILVPMTSRRAETMPAAGEREISSGEESILLVDDEEMIVDVMGNMLAQLGYRVESFTSSDAALERFRHKPQAFDLVITDMTMPGLNGAQLARQLVSIRGDIQVLICSGYNETIDESASRENGISGFIKKPIGMAELAENLREILDRGAEADVERRNYPRYQARRGSFVIFESSPARPAPLLDISHTGLSLVYDIHGGEPELTDRLSIICAESGFVVDRIPCETVSDTAASETDSDGQRRRGIRFDRLTRTQLRKLEAFIVNHTTATSVA